MTNDSLSFTSFSHPTSAKFLEARWAKASQGIWTGLLPVVFALIHFATGITRAVYNTNGQRRSDGFRSEYLLSLPVLGDAIRVQANWHLLWVKLSMQTYEMKVFFKFCLKPPC